MSELSVSECSMVERIFSWMAKRYGARFADMWDLGKGIPLEEVKRAWGNDLAGYSEEEVVRGIDACRKRPWPPTLPEFLLLCRPPPDYEGLYRAAANASGGGEWPSKLCYWAAQAFGMFEVRNGAWERNQARWKRCVDEMIADEPLPDVPPPRPTLPAPGRITTSRESAVLHIQVCREILAGKDRGVSR